jgi:sterol 14-demethylase
MNSGIQATEPGRAGGASSLPQPPALPSWPLIGNLPGFLFGRHGLIRGGYRRHGRVFSFRLGPQRVAVLLGPDHHETFFGETDKALSMDKPYANLAAIFGRVAFLAGREEYQEQRPVLYTPFRAEKMRQYVGIMQREAQRWIDSLGDGGEMEIGEEMKGLTQAIAGHALMGEDFQRAVGRAFWAEYDTIGQALNPAIPPHWPLPRNIRREKAKRRMTEILRPLIAERRNKAGGTEDFLQDFVEARGKSGELMEDEVVIGLLRALMFAGHETTAGHAAWAVIELLRHPEYLAKAAADVSQLPVDAPWDGQALRSQAHLLYLTKEVERLHPSADILLRWAEQDIEAGGYRIPKDWLVLVCPAVAHRLPENWSDPERFDPLRFAPERGQGAGAYSLIGFGGGRHKCPGMNFANTEILIVVAMLIRRMELTLLTPDPGTALGAGAARPKPARIRYRRRKAG